MHCHVQLKQTRGNTLHESYGRAAGQATLSCRGSGRTLGSGQGQAGPAPQVLRGCLPLPCPSATSEQRSPPGARDRGRGSSGCGVGWDSLGVEDDLRDLPVLHGRAIVVPGRVAEGEARLGPSRGRLVGDLAQALGAVVGVRALRGGARRVRMDVLRWTGRRILTRRSQQALHGCDAGLRAPSPTLSEVGNGLGGRVQVGVPGTAQGSGSGLGSWVRLRGQVRGQSPGFGSGVRIKLGVGVPGSAQGSGLGSRSWVGWGVRGTARVGVGHTLSVAQAV